MSSSFRVSELIYRHNQRRRGDNEDATQQHDYAYILNQVRDEISRNHAAEMSQSLGTKQLEEKLKRWISRYLNRLHLAENRNVAHLIEAIYNDMAGLGIIDAVLADPATEEIAINHWQEGGIVVQTTEGKRVLEQGFVSPEECRNVIVKAARLGDVILDSSKPFGDSFVSKGVRMSGIIDPCIDPDVGAVASIRVQRPSYVTRENVIKWGTATEDQLQLLKMLLMHGVSMAFAGPTGSGKTADMSLLLSELPSATRIYSIEDTAELNLTRYDEQGRVISDVVQTYTKEPPNPVSMNDLLREALRFNPEIIVTAEMRGAEALTVQEAGRTGHTIVSTLHANSAQDAYDRILTMALMSGSSLSEERLLRNIIAALPIMVFKRQLRDGSRKIMEIFEAIDVKEGRVIGNTLYRFVVTGKEKDAQGRIAKIIGQHAQIDPLSNAICQRLFDDGVELETIRTYRHDFTPLRVESGVD